MLTELLALCRLGPSKGLPGVRVQKSGTRAGCTWGHVAYSGMCNRPELLRE